jgi:hypothetical protein
MLFSLPLIKMLQRLGNRMSASHPIGVGVHPTFAQGMETLYAYITFFGHRVLISPPEMCDLLPGNLTSQTFLAYNFSSCKLSGGLFVAR